MVTFLRRCALGLSEALPRFLTVTRANDDRFSAFSFRDAGYGVGFAIRKY